MTKNPYQTIPQEVLELSLLVEMSRNAYELGFWQTEEYKSAVELVKIMIPALIFGRDVQQFSLKEDDFFNIFTLGSMAYLAQERPLPDYIVDYDKLDNWLNSIPRFKKGLDIYHHDTLDYYQLVHIHIVNGFHRLTKVLQSHP